MAATATASADAAEDTAVPVAPSKTLPWQLVALGETVAIIHNTSTNEKVRVAVGYDVPGCGRITKLNVDKRAIETSSGCIINRTKA